MELSQLQIRNARYAVSAVFLVFGVIVGSWLPHIPDVQKQLGVDYSALGRALLCSGFGAVAVMPFMGGLIHRFGSKRLALLGGTCACLLAPFLLLHTTVWGLSLNLVLIGLCYGGMDVAMNSHSVHVQALHERPVLAAIHGWFSFGGIVGGVSAAMAAGLGFSPFVHMTVICALLLLLLFWSAFHLLPRDPENDEEGPKFVLPRGILAVLGLFCVCAFVLEGGTLDWCSSYLRGTLHASPETGGIAIATSSGAIAGCRFLGDRLLHRFGDLNVVRISGFVASAGILAAVLTPSIPLSIFFFSLSCVGIANIVPVLFARAGTVPGVPAGAGLAAVTTCGYSGFLLGPPIIGAAARHISLGFSIGSLTVLGLIVALGSRFVFKEEK